jgi:hypothetical protein
LILLNICKSNQKEFASIFLDKILYGQIKEWEVHYIYKIKDNSYPYLFVFRYTEYNNNKIYMNFILFISGIYFILFEIL